MAQLTATCAALRSSSAQVALSDDVKKSGLTTMSDDDWETDADFENNLTEAEQRAYGNRETMEKYNTVMSKGGGSVPGEAKMSLAAPPAPTPPSVDVSDILPPPAHTPMSADMLAPSTATQRLGMSSQPVQLAAVLAEVGTDSTCSPRTSRPSSRTSTSTARAPSPSLHTRGPSSACLVHARGCSRLLATLFLASCFAVSSARLQCHPALCAVTSVAAPPPPHRAGFVSIVGVPNVGKSTLLNALLGERLSIATSKAQTTRHRILGIDNSDDHQIVFSDTPGVLLPQYRLQEGMMAFVRSSLNDADVLLLVVDVFQQDFPDEKVLRQLRASPAALLVLVNKVDLLDPEAAVDERRAAKAAERVAKLGTAEELLQRWRDEFPGATVLPLAARRGGDGGGVDAVRRHVLALLPEHPPFYPKEQLTDRPERFFAAEMLREAIFEHYSQEIPYSCECRVTSFKEAEEIIRMSAEIYVAHDSQKGVVIGKGGAALKKVGTSARKKMETFFDKKVFLETRVKVRANWRQDKKSLEEFGYID